MSQRYNLLVIYTNYINQKLFKHEYIDWFYLLIIAFKHPKNMRKNLLVFILIFFTVLLQAQIVLFSEDFNLGSIPSNFTTYDLDGNFTQ